MVIEWGRFALPKPGKRPRSRIARRRHRREKIAKRKTQAAVIAEVRALVFRLDQSCAVCLRTGRDSDEMHEIIPRSKTRGKPPEERFNRKICIRLHGACHKKVTEHAVRLEFLDASDGVDGGLMVYSSDGCLKHIYLRSQLPWQK